MSVSYITLVCMVAFSKAIYIFRYKDTLQKLCRGIEKFRPKANIKQETIFDNYLNQWHWLLLFNSIIVPVIGATFWSVCPLFNDNGIDLPFPAWYPFDYKQPIVFQLIYAHQIISAVTCAILNLNVDELMAGLMYNIAGEFVILENNLENLYELTNEFKISNNQNIFDEMNSTLLDLINYHKEICGYETRVKLKNFWKFCKIFQLCQKTE